MNDPTTNPVEEKRMKDEQLRIYYRMIFGSEHGKAILADLKHRFGWKGDVEAPSALPGSRPEDVFLTEGMKNPVRYILAMIQQGTEKPKLESTAKNE